MHSPIIRSLFNTSFTSCSWLGFMAFTSSWSVGPGRQRVMCLGSTAPLPPPSTWTSGSPDHYVPLYGTLRVFSPWHTSVLSRLSTMTLTSVKEKCYCNGCVYNVYTLPWITTETSLPFLPMLNHGWVGAVGMEKFWKICGSYLAYWKEWGMRIKRPVISPQLCGN